MLFVSQREMLWLLGCLGIARCLGNTQYEQLHSSVMRQERQMVTGEHLLLDKMEAKLDAMLLQHKQQELEIGRHNHSRFPASMHFFKAKSQIHQSWIFRLLRHMPKGALLHLHSTASVSGHWVRHNILTMQGLLTCVSKSNVTVLTFRRMPQMHECITDYKSVATIMKTPSKCGKRSRRRCSEDDIRAHFTLYTKHPEVKYGSAAAAWHKFEGIFESYDDMLKYQPVFLRYFRQMLQELHDDHIMYVELRMNFKPLYGPHNATYTKEQAIEAFLQLVHDFKQEHPSFLGVKIITPARKASSIDKIKSKIEEFQQLRAKYPNVFIGFDVIGHEDASQSLHDMMKLLLEAKKMPLLLHAGETNWFGTPTDYNLLDAILLKSVRIGHAYALSKHPVLLQRIKAKHIAIELSPISNQVLNLVSDMRNHPAAEFFARSLPMVICSDDPGFWESKGLSYDFYYAIMSMAPAYAGLRTLKKLVWDSVEYSILTKRERAQALDTLQRQWQAFVAAATKRG